MVSQSKNNKSSYQLYYWLARRSCIGVFIAQLTVNSLAYLVLVLIGPTCIIDCFTFTIQNTQHN